MTSSAGTAHTMNSVEGARCRIQPELTGNGLPVWFDVGPFDPLVRNDRSVNRTSASLAFGICSPSSPMITKSFRFQRSVVVSLPGASDPELEPSPGST